jgi:hypothetical protein
MTRRELLKRGTALGTAFVAGTGFLAHATDAWALELKALSPETMASLIQVARDIYPHDRIADKFYAIAVRRTTSPTCSSPTAASSPPGGRRTRP